MPPLPRGIVQESVLAFVGALVPMQNSVSVLILTVRQFECSEIGSVVKFSEHIVAYYCGTEA